MKARAAGRTVEVVGLNEASATLVERFGQHDKAEASLPAH
jgi:SulP family sulfate permease